MTNKHPTKPPEPTERPFLNVTAAGNGLANHPLKSTQSRAAARALVIARQETEVEEPFDPTGLAKRLGAALKKREAALKRGEEMSPPTYTPPRVKPRPGSLAERLDWALERRYRRYKEEKATEGNGI